MTRSRTTRFGSYKQFAHRFVAGFILFFTLLAGFVIYGATEVVNDFRSSQQLNIIDVAAGTAFGAPPQLIIGLYETSTVDERLTLLDRLDAEVVEGMTAGHAAATPVLRELLDQTQQAWLDGTREMRNALSGGAPDDALIGQAHALQSEIDDNVFPLFVTNEAIVSDRVDHAEWSQRMLELSLLTAMALAVATTTWLYRRLRHGILSPLAELQAASERRSRGDLSGDVPVRGADEVRELAEAFNEMTEGLTDRERLEAELRHAQKMESVGQLAAGIAHEINTPVQFVGDNIRFLADAFEDVLGDDPDADTEFLAAEIPEAIAQTLEGVERVATIVRAMKAFGHPANDEKAPADLNEAVRNTLVVAANEIRYVAEMDTDLEALPPVWCHLGDVNQIILNLVVNAAHAIAEKVGDTGERGTITVSTRHTGDHVALQITDTGCGIPDDNAHRVFEPFFTTKDVGAGTGQGLALAYSLVTERHHGTIAFTSRKDHGTTFTVTLPTTTPTTHTTPTPSNTEEVMA